MERTVELSVLFAYYGDFLTQRQREILSFRVDDDYSLGEIAQREGISRQAVYDLVHRAQSQLYEMENKLKLVMRARAMEQALAHFDRLIENTDMSGSAKLEFLKQTKALRDIWEDENGV